MKIEKVQKNIEYVLYCRKSRDEVTKQASSIPQQIEACMRYAEREGLRIRTKPEAFEFETDTEIDMEDNEPELVDRQTYKKYRHLYIIRERKSAKEPGIRDKWKKLMGMVDSGRIQGILSYAPDRQARNLLEAGYLIDLVDKDKVELKYPNFAFEPNAAGKMMLGIWFVFSKQYSDKLSEDSSRGSEGKIEAGKAIGRHKYGYDINDEGHHYPHPEHFQHMKEAFRIKIEENKSDEFIAKWLQSKGVVREYRKEGKKATFISARTLNDVWKDPFYYGIFEYGDIATNQFEKNPYYEPVITKEEHNILMERHYSNKPHKGDKTVKQEHVDVMPFDDRFIKTTDDSYLSFNLPNKKRFLQKLDNLKKTNPDILLKDIVKPNQIYYGCKNKKSLFYGFEITFDKIEQLIIEKLKTLYITESHYEEYRIFMEGTYKDRQQQIAQEKRILERNRVTANDNLSKYVIGNAGKPKDETEERIYRDEKNRLENIVSNMDQESLKLTTDARNELLEFEAFFQILNNTDTYYSQASYVQKRMIVSILFSNILLTPEKTLQIAIKPGLEGLFSNIGDPITNKDKTFERVLSYIKEEFSEVSAFVQQAVDRIPE